MNFTNEEIDAVMLPAMETVKFNPPERSYLLAKRIALVLTGILALVLTAILLFFFEQLQTRLLIFTVPGFILLMMVLGYLHDTISFRYSGYALRQRDVLSKHGWIFHKTRVVPLNRVQHVSVQSGPIERRFGLASVSIFTAGSASADFTIKGITRQTALQIKDWISNQLNEQA